MNKFGQLVVINNRPQWQHYQEELKAEFFRDRDTKTTPMEFPAEPKTYPCLVAAMTQVADVTQIGALARVAVHCCFVYPKDAARLQAVARQASADWNPMIDPILGENDPDEFDDDFGPSEIGALVLALVLELRSLGALKQDRLISTVGRVRDWLEDNIEENLEDDDTVMILKRLWTDLDAG